MSCSPYPRLGRPQRVSGRLALLGLAMAQLGLGACDPSPSDAAPHERCRCAQDCIAPLRCIAQEQVVEQCVPLEDPAGHCRMPGTSTEGS